METARPNEAQLFHAFLSQQLATGTSKSPEDLLSLWRSEPEEFDDAVEAVREGLADIATGRVISREQFDREFRERHNIPKSGE